jgi:serine phosphatase RsbU (regulator of sigma subunit)
MKKFNHHIRLFCLIPFLVIYCQATYAQTAAIDSLRKKLNVSAADTNRVNILADLCLKLIEINQNEAVLKYAREALGLSASLDYKKGVAVAYTNIAAAQRQESNYAEALKNSMAALKVGEESHNKKIMVEAYYSSGRIQADWGNYEEALKDLGKCLEISKQITDKKRMADSYGSMGLVLDFSGNYAEALKDHLLSLKIRTEMGDKKRMAFSYNNIGIVQADLGNYPEALKSYLQAIKIEEEIGDKMRASEAYNNMGNLYENMRNYREALKNQFISLKLKKELSDENGMVFSYINIGNIYFEMNKFSEALKTRITALEMQKKLGGKKSLNICYNNLGKSFFQLQNYAQALKNYLEAQKLCIELKDKPGMAECFRNLEEVYARQKLLPLAKAYMDSALTILKEIRNKGTLEQAYLQYADLDSAMNNFQQAYLHQKLYALYHDSLFNEANTKKVVSAEMNFEFEKKQAVAKAEQEKITAVAAAENRKQKIIIIGVSILLLLILAFAFFAYRNYRLKKRSNIRLEIQKKNIDDSIRYAQRIQQAILPTDLFHVSEGLEYCIYYQPKDIVSGDFYWRHRIGDELFFAAVDCTGHGVPGAMMSMLGYDLLEYAVTDRGLREPADILNLMNKKIIQKLNNNNDKASTDGMDMSLCRLNLNTKELTYAGAKNDLYRYSKNKLELLPVTKYSIGYEAEHVFTQSAVPLQSGDMLWLFTDGYCDQKGGPEGKKFMRTRWKELLQKIAPMSSGEQKTQLITGFDTWKGMHSQRDDILVIGIRV